MPKSSLLHAAQMIVARSGLYWVAVIVVPIAFWQLAPSGAAFWGVPLLFAAGLWLFLFGMKDRADHRAVLNLTQGNKPKNGQWVSVCGKAQALDPEAIQGGHSILACRFQVLYEETIGLRESVADGRRKPRLKPLYDGFYLTPTVIKSADTAVTLAGFPDLIHMEKKGLPDEIMSRAKAAARKNHAYIPPFVARELVLSQAVTQLEDCIYYGTAEGPSPCKTKSWILSDGDEVCVFGIWKDGALRASYKRARGLPVYAGNAETVRETLQGDSKAFLIVGGVVLAIALVWAVWSLV